MWEMRAACIIVADVVVVSDICIESGRQGEGGGACADRVPIPNKLKLQHTRQIAVSSIVCDFCFFGCCGLLIPTLQSPWFVHWTWETLVKAGSSSD